jgi:hypothetical protein
MLFRGDTPLTPEEALDYEFGRELQRMLKEGLVMEIIRPSGEPGWKLTLKGLREFGSENLLRITFEKLDSSC